MSRMPALAATVLLALAASPAMVLAAAPPPAPAAATEPRKATSEERAMAERMDPIARAAFWGREAELDPRDAAAGVALCRALRVLGRHDDAIAAAEKVLVVDPNAVEALLELARVQIARGQGFYAIDPARRAAALAPADWRPVGLLAVGLEQAQRDDEAFAAHKQAVALAPREAAPLANLAMYYAGHQDLLQAESLLRTALSFPSAGARERQNLSLVLGLQGRFDEAERLARQDLPPEAVANNLAYFRRMAGAGGQRSETRSWNALKEAPGAGS